MRKVILERLDSSDQGTFGRIYLDGVLFYTGELPWRDNQSNVSCIPPGIYEAEFTRSPRFGKTYELEDVPDRTYIRIHKANLAGDVAKGFRSHLNGCIMLGEKLGWINGQKAVLASGPAIRRFEKLMESKPFTLEVIDGND